MVYGLYQVGGFALCSVASALDHFRVGLTRYMYHYVSGGDATALCCHPAGHFLICGVSSDAGLSAFHCSDGVSSLCFDYASLCGDYVGEFSSFGHLRRRAWYSDDMQRHSTFYALAPSSISHVRAHGYYHHFRDHGCIQ